MIKLQAICDQQTAKQAAKRIFEKYRTGNTIGQNEIGSIMRDVYFNIQKGYTPNPWDVTGYSTQLDANKDGKVTLEDLEAKAIRYLCGGFDIVSNFQGSPPRLQRKLTNTARSSLSVAKRLFEMYQDPEDKTIREHQVFHVIKQTYEGIGRKDFQPSEEDVRVWMQLCDSNKDGRVVYEEYQNFVVKSLQRAGVTLYEE